MLGQLATEAKSNEITAFPLLIEMVDLKRAIVTIDAAGCQKEIAEKIRDSRLEQLEVWSVDDLEWLPEKGEWKDLQRLVCLKSGRTHKGTYTVEMRYYISSLPSDAVKLAHAIRSHWGVENKCIGS